MSKIPTGFTYNKFYGAIEEEDLLSRYIPISRLAQLLERGIWFTRTYAWKDSDACEASLIPAFKRYIRQGLHGEAEFIFARAVMEFGLKAAFGCCFSSFSAGENDGMWRAYTPKPEYGVMIVIRGKSLFHSMEKQSNFFRRQLLKKVTYLTDQKAKEMTPLKCKHQQIGKRSCLDFAESHFYKREAFRYEHEIRAVLTSPDCWTEIFHVFINDKKIPLLPISTIKPTDQPYYRIDIRSNLDTYSPNDKTVLLTVEQANEFAQVITTRSTEFFERPWFDGTNPLKGLYLPFDPKDIEKIIIHPSFNDSDPNYLDLKELLLKHDLFGRASRSNLYDKEW